MTPLDRRTLLASLGGWAVLVGLAGCQGTDPGGTATGTPAPTDTPTPTATGSPTPEETPAGEPLVFSNRVTVSDFDPLRTSIRGYEERLLQDDPLGASLTEFAPTFLATRTRWTAEDGLEFREGIGFFRNEEYTLEAGFGADPETGDLVVDQLAYPNVNDRPFVDESPAVGLPRARELGLETSAQFREQFDETIESISYFDPWFLDGRSEPVWLASSLPPEGEQVKLSLVSSSTPEVLDAKTVSRNPAVNVGWGWKAGWLVLKIWLGKWSIVLGIKTAPTGWGLIIAIIGLLMWIIGLIMEALSIAHDNRQISKKKYNELKKLLKDQKKKLKNQKEIAEKRKKRLKEIIEKLREVDGKIDDVLDEMKEAGGKNVDENVKKIKDLKEELKKIADEEGKDEHGGPVFDD